MGIDMLEVETTLEGGGARVRLIGELTAATEPVLRMAIRNIDLAALDRAEFDLSRLDFIDSAGLAALLRIRARLVAHAVPMLVVAPSTATRRILDAGSLGGVFEILDDG